MKRSTSPTAVASQANGSETPAEAAAYMVMTRVIQRTERELGAWLRSYKLNAGQLDVLMAIAAAEGLTQGDLAERICHSKANVSQLIHKMEASGLVRREPVGRAYALFVTSEGTIALDAALPDLCHVIEDQFASLTSDERAEFFRLITKLDREIA